MKPTGWKRVRRGCSAYASESDTTNLHSSIFISPIKRDLGFAGIPRAGSPLRWDRPELVRVGHLYVKKGYARKPCQGLIEKALGQQRHRITLNVYGNNTVQWTGICISDLRKWSCLLKKIVKRCMLYGISTESVINRKSETRMKQLGNRLDVHWAISETF